MRRIENQLKKMEKKISILEVQESGRLMRLMKELNAKSRVRADLRDTAAEMRGWRCCRADDVASHLACAGG